MNRILSLFSFSLGLALVAGCGGGSSDPVALSSGNLEALAAQGVETSELMVDVGDLTETLSEVVQDPAAQVVLCSDGNASVVVDDTEPLGELNAGDSVDFVFNGCVLDEFGLAVMLNGSASFSVTQATSDEGAGTFSFRLSTDFDALSLTAFGATVVLDGGFDALLESADGVTLRRVVSGSRLSAFATGGNQSVSRTITDFVHEWTLDTSTDAYTADLSATVSGSRFPGEFVYDTTQVFGGLLESAPDSGQLVLVGPLGGRATLNALDTVNVQILLDVDGDEDTDVTVNTTWDELLG